MLRLCFGRAKTDVLCTSDLSRDKTRATQNRTKIGLRAFWQAFSLRSREQLVPSALRAVLETSQDPPGAPQAIPGTSPERPGTVPSASESRSGAFRQRPGSPWIARNRAKSASDRFFLDFTPPRTVPGASQKRPESHFGMIFVSLVRSFVRAIVCCFLLCWFVRSLARWFAYTRSADCARATKRKTKRAGFALRPSFCCSSFPARLPRFTPQLAS